MLRVCSSVVVLLPFLTVFKHVSRGVQGSRAALRFLSGVDVANPLWSLQVVAFHQAARRQRAGVGEEGRLYVQPPLRQCGVAAGGGTHLFGLGEVRLLPLSWGGNKESSMFCTERGKKKMATDEMFDWVSSLNILWTSRRAVLETMPASFLADTVYQPASSFIAGWMIIHR